uniref:Uncharacterized protein n=1 Tax=Anguilla anguilla TaxID=7936 RepID=A0A0E9UIH1_ANGAN
MDSKLALKLNGCLFILTQTLKSVKCRVVPCSLNLYQMLDP